MQLLRKTFKRFISKLNTELPHNPSISFLGINPKGMKIYAHAKTCTQTVMTVSVIPKCKPPTCPRCRVSVVCSHSGAPSGLRGGCADSTSGAAFRVPRTPKRPVAPHPGSAQQADPERTREGWGRAGLHSSWGLSNPEPCHKAPRPCKTPPGGQAAAFTPGDPAGGP